MSNVAPTSPRNDESNGANPALVDLNIEEDDRQSLPLDAKSRWMRRRKEFLRNSLAFIDQLGFVELAALYYMDNSAILLLIRGSVQLGIAAPALYPHAFRVQDPNFKHRRPSVFMILFVNLLAFFIHISLNPPSAGEPTRGYLHGGLLIDFVGQKSKDGWFGKLQLCALDVMVLILQLLACGVIEELPTSTADSRAPTRTSTSIQRPTRRLSLPTPTIPETAGEGIELQPLLSQANTNNQTQGAGTGAADTNQTDQQQDSDAQAWHDLLVLYSGQTILFDFNVFRIFTNQYWDYRNRRRIGTV